ncbi:MAG: hypothetical protein AB1765_13195 [Candidatus Hydrogenedentota bacterium]
MNKKRFIPKTNEPINKKEVINKISLWEEWKDFILQNAFIWCIIGILSFYEIKSEFGDDSYRWIYIPVALCYLIVSLVGKFVNIDKESENPKI